MPVKRRIAKTRTRVDINPDLWAWLNDDCPTLGGENAVFWEALMLECWPDKLRAVWEQVHDEVLANWAINRPGKRPKLWWSLDAPRQPIRTYPGCYFDGKLSEPRKRLGGSGETPWDAGQAVVPSFEYGLPTSWETFDEEHPPLFESEAAYLLRHGLLSPAERRKLKAADFQPVAIDLGDDESEGEAAE